MTADPFARVLWSANGQEFFCRRLFRLHDIIADAEFFDALRASASETFAGLPPLPDDLRLKIDAKFLFPRAAKRAMEPKTQDEEMVTASRRRPRKSKFVALIKLVIEIDLMTRR
jgi:hypothetical protein